MAIGASARKVIEILKAPTSVLEKHSRPLLIRINELPQISARPARILHAMIRLREEELLIFILIHIIRVSQR